MPRHTAYIYPAARDDFTKRPIKFLQKAAAAGDAGAQCELGDRYENGRDGVKQSAEQAVFWARKSAQQGNPQAQYALAFYYYSGFGVVAADYQLAAEWAVKSAMQDNGDAFKLIALLNRKMIALDDNQEAGKFIRTIAPIVAKTFNKLTFH